MNQNNLEHRSVSEIKRSVKKEGPPEPRVVHCNAESEWDPEMLCKLSEHELHVLGRSADIVVFFNKKGKVIGWRDDGRKGSEFPGGIERGFFLKKVVTELDLPDSTRLGKLKSTKLPPLGWTYYAVLFLAPMPRDKEILNVWVDPGTLRVIQCLYDQSTHGAMNHD